MLSHPLGEAHVSYIELKPPQTTSLHSLGPTTDQESERIGTWPSSSPHENMKGL